MKKLLLICLLIVRLSYCSTDLVIFSFDRGMQLYALLESIELNCRGLNDIWLIYRTSTSAFEQAYEKVIRRFPYVKAIAQPQINAEIYFKEQLNWCLKQSSAEHIMFAVDDNIVIEPVDISICTKHMKQCGAYGFYLRLGTNLNYCYPTRSYQALPSLRNIEQDVYAWQFNAGQGDWGYPNTVDMTIYAKSDVIDLFKVIQFKNPNTLEAAWASCANYMKIGLCFAKSKIMNIPMNIVQHTFANRHMSHAQLFVNQLNDLFLAGKKIDILPLQGMENKSAHTEIEPTFIEC